MKNQDHSQIANQNSVNDQQQETLLIKQLIAEFEKVRNQNDAEGYTALFTLDAVLVTPSGARLMHRNAIYEFAKKSKEIYEYTKEELKGPFFARFEVVHISFLRPDVAVVSVLQYPITKEGKAIEDEAKGNIMFVVVKEQGQWMIAAVQGTIIAEVVK